MEETKLNKTALVVEDDRALSSAISKKLELSGIKVLTAVSVDEALIAMNNSETIDVIWLDHYLFGDKNGIDFVTAVKGHPEWQNIPIYIVSNTASDDKVKSYIRLGIAKYYVKANHSLQEIIAAIKANLDEEPTND